MSWLLLVMAILFEVAGTTCLKLANGFTRVLPTLGVLGLYGFSFFCLGLVVKRMEIGVAYAVWSGLGTALVAAIGVACFKESASALKFFSLALVVIGLVGLHLANGHHPAAGNGDGRSAASRGG